MIELTMPQLSDSMQHGTIIAWLKADGEQVQAGDELLEIETDKATMTHAAEASGTLQILAPEGESLPVGAPIAQLHNPAAPWAREAPPTTAGNGASPTREQDQPLSTAVPAPSYGDTENATVKATPLARRIAAQHGMSLLDVPGTGPNGRITRADVLISAGLARSPSLSHTPTPTASATAPAPHATDAAATAGADTFAASKIVELTRLQTVVARRMAEAKATIPHFQVQTDVEMEAALAVREQLKQALTSAPSLNDLIIKAAALALRDHPLANGSYRDGHFELHRNVNVGVAVATDSALLVPTIFDADRKSLGTIADETRTLASRVREQTITPPELSGATFTVSNLGMYGMTAITPVINPPQAAILGVGALRSTLHLLDGELADRQVLTLTLSCDHRILYGADAARFLSAIRHLLEHPLQLVL